MTLISFVWLVAFIGCLFQVGYATRTNYTLSGSDLLGSAVEYNPPVGDPNGWTVTKDGIMTTAAGATATFSLHAIGIYAFTNASAGASYTFQVDPYSAQSNADTGPDFTIQMPKIQLATQRLTITNLVAGQSLTIHQINYTDCVNDEAGDCFFVPLVDIRSQPGQLDHLAGPIAGGIIGLTVLVVATILFIYHRRRVARRKAREASHRPLDFSAMQKSSPSAMSQRDIEAQHAALPVSFGNKGGVLSSKASASDGSSTSGDDDVKLDDNVLAFTDADIAKITAGGSKPSPTSTNGSAWAIPQRPSPSRQNPKRSSLTWSISSYSDASSR
jgi:hypothetical protein